MSGTRRRCATRPTSAASTSCGAASRSPSPCRPPSRPFRSTDPRSTRTEHHCEDPRRRRQPRHAADRHPHVAPGRVRRPRHRGGRGRRRRAGQGLVGEAGPGPVGLEHAEHDRNRVPAGAARLRLGRAVRVRDLGGLARDAGQGGHRRRPVPHREAVHRGHVQGAPRRDAGMSTVLLPAAKDVRDMLSGLVGKEVTVSPGAPVTPEPNRPVTVAIFTAPDMSVNALCVMDLGASAYTAAALALLPPGGAQDAVEEDKELSPMLLEALHEVVNVLSALFNTPGAPHSKLNKLVPDGDDVPGDIAGMLAGFNRLDLALEVPGYGKGALSLVLP